MKTPSSNESVALAVPTETHGVNFKPSHVELIVDADPMPLIPELKPPLSVPDTDPEYWVFRINRLTCVGVAAWIEAGRALISAKERVKHGQWSKMFEPGRLTIRLRTAQILMGIACHPVLANANNYSRLPNTLNALKALSQMTPDELENAFAEQKISPKMTIRQAAALVDSMSEQPPEIRTPKSWAIGRHVRELTRILERGWESCPTSQRKRMQKLTHEVVEKTFLRLNRPT